jgi:hypothetical protein
MLRSTVQVGNISSPSPVGCEKTQIVVHVRLGIDVNLTGGVAKKSERGKVNG